jgi:hypothetical protein
MKTHTAIIGADGQRKITSTTEQLRIPASEIRPGDWLLKPHRRGMEKDKLVGVVGGSTLTIILDCGVGGSVSVRHDHMVDVERTS